MSREVINLSLYFLHGVRSDVLFGKKNDQEFLNIMNQSSRDLEQNFSRGYLLIPPPLDGISLDEKITSSEEETSILLEQFSILRSRPISKLLKRITLEFSRRIIHDLAILRRKERKKIVG